MSKEEYCAPVKTIKLELTVRVVEAIDGLVKVGFYGASRSQVAGMLIGRELERMAASGTLEALIKARSAQPTDQ
jgi:hypothetical protein